MEDTQRAALNPEQQAAVALRQGPVQLIAGAGAGKTMTLIERIGALISIDEVPPANILAVTFTNKAADEIRDRLEERIGIEAQYVCSGTIHSIMLNEVLRSPEIDYEVMLETGIDPHNIEVIDEDRSRKLLRDAVANLPGDMLPEWTTENCDIDVLTHVMNNARAAGMGVDQWEKTPAAQYGVTPKAVPLLAWAWREYTQMCRDRASVDYDDILLLSADVLRKDAVFASEMAARFMYVHVDEYQDINPVQSQIIDLIANGHDNVFVVGDEKQSIYKFRGADISVILGFQQRYPNAKLIELSRNYRSQPGILEAANACAACMRERVGGSGKLRTMSELPRQLPTVVRFGSEAEEASCIIQAIQRDIREGATPSEIAVLYRSRQDGEALEQEAVRAGLPYRKVRDTAFFSRAAVRNTLAMMRFLATDAASDATIRVLDETTWGVSGKTARDKRKEGMSPDAYLRKLAGTTNANGDLSKVGKTVTAINELRNQFRDLLSIPGGSEDVIQRLQQFWDVSLGEKLRRAKAQDKLPDHQTHANALFERTAQLMSEGGTFQDALEEFSLLSDLAADEGAHLVNFLTIHAAKGLEWDNVYMIGQNSARDIEESEVEEERRVFYVGMTRARERLVISYPDQHELRHKKDFDLRQSRYLDEIGFDVVRQIDMRNRVPQPQRAAPAVATQQVAMSG